ncbi:hypothetical protein CDL12_28356 [Handroanthus impetiginosus]|uniref:Uncharacterized protein n=1 Tax=Handroanthus impetiginosus TaxID=429701 RepID=A0A2G9G1F2_9LAMI|nr:hypothetical protein CDL12_28356 [Handroanthus impetiginosus]
MNDLVRLNHGFDDAQVVKNEKKIESAWFGGIEPDVNRTRNLLIWSQTRYHCATDPVVAYFSNLIVRLQPHAEVKIFEL